MNEELQDRLIIRELIENWVLWRDARMWDKFRTVWHDDGRMMATWAQGTAEEFIENSKKSFANGMRVMHLLGGSSVEVRGKRAIAQTKMTILQRALVHGMLCDVTCIGRFYDFLEKRDRRWGIVLRQPIYEFFGQSSFASYALCTERNVVKVPKDSPLERLGPLACGIQTGAGAVINSLKVGVGKSFAVFGAGSVGLAAIMAARLVGATIIVAVDLNEKRLELARELGATHTINSSKDDAVERIMEITGAGVHYALETTANSKVIRQAVDSLTLRGQCGLVGASSPGSEISLDAMHLMTAGRKVRGIVEGDSAPDIFIPQLIELQRQGRFPYDRMLTFYDMEGINQAISDSESGTVVKPIVRMAQD